MVSLADLRVAQTLTNNPMHGSGEVGRICNGQSIVAAPCSVTLPVQLMVRETRSIDTTYFDLNGANVGRTCRVCGDFGAYDGSYKTLSHFYWLERDGKRERVTLPRLYQSIDALQFDGDSVGFANFVADAHGLGCVVSANFTDLVDFERTFGRTQHQMFPRRKDDQFQFVTTRSFGEPIVTATEYWDITVAIPTFKRSESMFWSGDRRELVLNLDYLTDDQR